jgi:hypothetical protein
MTFSESSLQLTFDPEAWEVIAYDRHRYYNTLKGAGLRGVDFLGIWREDTLVLLEIKNFRVRPAGQSEAAIRILLEQPDLLIEAMAEKRRDTLKGLEGIEGYWRRRWWYRLLEPRLLNARSRWLRRLPASFWARVFARRDHLQVFLWLETDPAYEGWDKFRVEKFRQYLREELAARGVELIGNGSNPFSAALLVRVS